MGDQSIRALVPRRPDAEYRDVLWNYCRRWWETHVPELELIEGASPEGPFNRAAAINDAAKGAWDVAVVIDADVVVDAKQLRDAVALARGTQRMTLAFESFTGLGPSMTKKVLAGYKGNWDKGARYRSTIHESSIVAIPRRLWDLVEGFDERFIGWGQEDVAFAQACRVLGGAIERVPGVVYHLWHPKAVERRTVNPLYQANQALGQRYRLTREPEAMRQLLAERFNTIYETNEWNGKDGTRSGPGSSLEATEILRRTLPDLLSELGIGTVLDAGCGDALWQPELPGYIGIDISSVAVGRARRRHPERDFRTLDMCTDELPRCDAIICRDALQHLSLVDGLTALQNFRRSGAKWLLANTHRGGKNVDVPSGGWFEIDLEAGPFWLGEPVREIPDGAWKGQNRYPNKVFGIWEL